MNLGARTRGAHETELRVQPVAVRLRTFRGEDLDALTAFERRVERHLPAVHPRAAAAVADFGMNPVSKVHRRRACDQIEHVATWREHVDPIVLDPRPQLTPD